MHETTFTPDEAIRAIRSRIAGNWDDPALARLGPLLPDTLEDIKRILDAVEGVV